MAIHNEPKTAAPPKESKGRNRHSKKRDHIFNKFNFNPNQVVQVGAQNMVIIKKSETLTLVVAFPLEQM